MEKKYVILEGLEYIVTFKNEQIETIHHSYWRMSNKRARQVTKQIKYGPLFLKIASHIKN